VRAKIALMLLAFGPLCSQARATTRNAAIFMNALDRYGSVSSGKIADLVLLDADPLQDIRNTTRIQEVFLAGKEFNRTTLDGILKTADTAASASAQLPNSLSQPPPEMLSLAKAFEGAWSIEEQHEPSEFAPEGRRGHATEIWRRGPGGFTFMEEFRDDSPTGEFGLAVMWWDKTKGFKNTGAWCDKTTPTSCTVFVNDPSASFQWNGKQQVINNEFQRNGKTYSYHEVLADITPTSFLQTIDIGVKGGQLKRFLTIHATRIASEPQLPPEVLSRDVAAASPEMQKLLRVFQGRWSYHVDRENGDSGAGEQIWRAGPGGVELIEDLNGASHDLFGLSVTWWDAVDRGYRTIWCDNTLPTGCVVMSKLAQWEGSDFVLRDECERDGKKFDSKEVVSEITPNTYTQTIYQGEAGGELKPVLTIHATKVTDSAPSSQQIDPAFYGFWTLNVEKSDFGNRAKPKAGFVNWGEHGWTFAIVQADGRVYADAVETSHGCTFIGIAPTDLSCAVEVVTSRHVRLTMKQGATIRLVGDIELLEDGTTRTTHHVTPSQGAPYMEKTIWEKQVRK
jgi:amidohydrolase family protein